MNLMLKCVYFFRLNVEIQCLDLERKTSRYPHPGWLCLPCQRAWIHEVLTPTTPAHPPTHPQEVFPACSVTSVVSDPLQPHALQPARLFCPWDSPGKNTAVGCHAVLRRIFPTQGSNPSLLSLALVDRFFTSRAIWEAPPRQEANIIQIISALLKEGCGAVRGAESSPNAHRTPWESQSRLLCPPVNH